MFARQLVDLRRPRARCAFTHEGAILTVTGGRYRAESCYEHDWTESQTSMSAEVLIDARTVTRD